MWTSLVPLSKIVGNSAHSKYRPLLYIVSKIRISSYATKIENHLQRTQQVKSFSRTSLSSYQHIHSNQLSNLAYEVDSNVSKDVLIYSNNSHRFYTILTYFGVVQCIFWTYLSGFAYKYLKDISIESEDQQLGIERNDGSWWKKFTRWEGMYKNGISLICFSIGYLVLFISLTYPLRAVHKMWILRGGKSVQLVTFAWFGRTKSYPVPLQHINCLQSRLGSGTQIPLKIKGRWFFYLMDKSGTFHNTKLFDYTVGLVRKLK